MTLYRDHGIVLRTHKLGESDRIISFITERHGKVRAVAKGVRKTRSRFGSRLEPTSHVALLLYEGRELDIVTQAESVDHFRALRDDLDHAAEILTRGRTGDRDYVAQFVAGVARSAGDPSLERLADALAEGRARGAEATAEAQALAAALHQRMAPLPAI